MYRWPRKKPKKFASWDDSWVCNPDKTKGFLGVWNLFNLEEEEEEDKRQKGRWEDGRMD